MPCIMLHINIFNTHAYPFSHLFKSGNNQYAPLTDGDSEAQRCHKGLGRATADVSGGT